MDTLSHHSTQNHISHWTGKEPAMITQLMQGNFILIGNKDNPQIPQAFLSYKEIQSADLPFPVVAVTMIATAPGNEMFYDYADRLFEMLNVIDTPPLVVVSSTQYFPSSQEAENKKQALQMQAQDWIRTNSPYKNILGDTSAESILWGSDPCLIAFYETKPVALLQLNQFTYGPEQLFSTITEPGRICAIDADFAYPRQEHMPLLVQTLREVQPLLEPSVLQLPAVDDESTC